MADEIADSIEANAQKPKRVEGDAGSVEQHSLKDQIEADRYLASRNSASNPHRGIRFTKLKPPGAD